MSHHKFLNRPSTHSHKGSFVNYSVLYKYSILCIVAFTQRFVQCWTSSLVVTFIRKVTHKDFLTSLTLKVKVIGSGSGQGHII